MVGRELQMPVCTCPSSSGWRSGWSPKELGLSRHVVAHVGDRLVDIGGGERLKLKLPRLRPAKRRHAVAPPERIIGGSSLDPARIEAARERLRREIPPRPDEDWIVRDIAIRGDMIRLGQLLKLANIINSGGELKALLAETDVLVNGELEDRRGRQLHPGDVVTVAGDDLRIVAGD